MGLSGFRGLEVTETLAEFVVTIETRANRVGCDGCGTRAESQHRVRVAIRGSGVSRPTGAVGVGKRRWRCREPLCDRRTWTETSDHRDAQVVLTPSMSVSRSAVPAAATPVAVAIDCVDLMSAENIGKVDSGRQSRSRALVRCRGWLTSSGCAGGRS